MVTKKQLDLLDAATDMVRLVQLYLDILAKKKPMALLRGLFTDDATATWSGALARHEPRRCAAEIIEDTEWIVTHYGSNTISPGGMRADEGVVWVSFVSDGYWESKEQAGRFYIVHDVDGTYRFRDGRICRIEERWNRRPLGTRGKQ